MDISAVSEHLPVFLVKVIQRSAKPVIADVKGSERADGAC